MQSDISYRHGEYMLGHVLPETQSAYYRLPDRDSMREAYLKALPSLMILEPAETIIVTDERLERLEEKIAEQQEWIEILRRKDKLQKP